MGEMREWHVRNVTAELDEKAHTKAEAKGETFQGYVRRLVKEDVDGTRNGTRRARQIISPKVSQAKEADERCGTDDQKQNGHLVLANRPAAKQHQDLPLAVGNGKTEQLSPDDVMHLAAHIVEVLGMTDSAQLRDAIAATIRSKSQAKGITVVAAHDRVLLETALAMQEGMPLPFECAAQETITNR
jgi:hypothetical protein